MQIKFTYDCILVRPGHRYQIALQSLPAVESVQVSNVNVTVVNIPTVLSTGIVIFLSVDIFCETADDPILTKNDSIN